MEPEWSNRIVGYEPEVEPDQLTAHPLNARRHPGRQRDALRESLGRVGWVDVVKVNTRTGNVVDGHARVEEALTKGGTVPVLYVELEPDEERFVLATLDPISAMATYDAEVLTDLMDGLTVDSEALAEMLGKLTDGQLADLDPSGSGFGSLGDERALAGPPPEAASPGPGGPGLADRFLVPPFSVLDARQGYWRERKRAWLALGIRSEVGRPTNLLGMSEQVLSGYGESAPKNSNRSVPNSHHTADPGFYDKKARVESQIGREMSSAEFIAEHYEPDPIAGTSIFDPVLCELAYRWWCPPGGAILDPFAGGSVRGIVAHRIGCAYTGVELRFEQVEANREQAANICADGYGPTPEWIEGDSRVQLPELDQSYDFVFSCPPYGDLEVYSDLPDDLSTLDYPDFIAAYREIIAAAVDRLHDNRFAAFVVGDIRDKNGNYRGFVPDTIAAFTAAGATYYNEAAFITPTGSLALRAGRIFGAARKLAKAHQNLLVFCKGDPKKAAESLGELELPDPAELFGEPLTDTEA
jgi:hypothetical protein